MNKMEIRKGDLVEIICGGIEAKGKRGKVLAASPKNGTVVVEGLNMVKRHTRPRSAQQAGGIIEKPRAIDVSNVMIVCPACDKAVRIAHVQDENGKWLRKCGGKKGCGAVITDRKEEKPAKKAATKRKTTKKAAEQAE